jgi:hypothetical protein
VVLSAHGGAETRRGDAVVYKATCVELVSEEAQDVRCGRGALDGDQDDTHRYKDNGDGTTKERW